VKNQEKSDMEIFIGGDVALTIFTSAMLANISYSSMMQ